MSTNFPIHISHFYPADEINKIGEDQIRFAIGLAILTELEKHNLIQYTRSKNSEGTFVEGKLTINVEET